MIWYRVLALTLVVGDAVNCTSSECRTEGNLFLQHQGSLGRRSAATSYEMFAPVGGGKDQACRGKDSSDNSGSYYTVVTADSLDECREKCLQMEKQLCKGIEYSGITRCELWTRPEGIQFTTEKPGFTCEANMQAPVFWTDLSFLRGGENEACRKSNPNDNSVDYYHVVENIYKLKDCQAACMNADMCKGIEYSYGRCEVWNNTIRAVKELPPAVEVTTAPPVGSRLNRAVNCPPPGASKCPTGSSTVRSGEEHVSRMNDENLETQWASAAGDAEPWAWIDLQETCTVVEVAIHWGDDSEYELQSKVDGIWTTVASNVGVAGETVRNVLSEAADTQWIRIKCSGSCVIKEVFVYEAGDGTTEIGGPPTDILANRNEPVSVHASSFPEDGLKVIDGNLTTQWTSSPGDQWIWLDLKGSYELDHVVVSWGSKMPSSFDIDMSFIPAEYWDLLVADVIPTSGDQFIHFPTGTTTQWVRVHCKGATEGCSIAELQVFGPPATTQQRRSVCMVYEEQSGHTFP